MFSKNIYLSDKYLVFCCKDKNEKQQICIYDGLNKPASLSDFPDSYSSNLRMFMTLNNKLYFIANYGVNGDEFWYCLLND